MSFPDEQHLRETICDIGRLMYRNGYIDGAGGNISARLNNNTILTTPSGIAKGFMSPEQLILVNMSGKRVDTHSDPTLRPTTELSMHLECYHQRPDVNGVVHAHPPYAVALTIAGYDFRRCIIPEMVVMLGLMPTTPYSTPSSTENRDAIQGLIAEHDALMLAHHGSLTVADSVRNAYYMLETLEHGAKILTTVEQLGGAQAEIPPQHIKSLLQTREKLGLLRPGDRERFAQFCDCKSPE